MRLVRIGLDFDDTRFLGGDTSDRWLISSSSLGDSATRAISSIVTRRIDRAWWSLVLLEYCGQVGSQQRGILVCDRFELGYQRPAAV